MAAAGAAKKESLSIVSFVVGSVLMLTSSIFFGVIAEWIGMTWFWPEKGALHAMEMVVKEAGYLNDEFVHAAFFGWTPTDVVNYVAQYITGAPLTGETLEPKRWQEITGILGDGRYIQGVQNFLLAAIYIAMVCTIRLVIIMFTIPLYALFFILAFFDGLMLRDLRRFGGARESGIRYHYSKKFVIPSLWGGWGLYMAIPISVHPNMILVPSVILGSFSLWIATRYFKKYL